MATEELRPVIPRTESHQSLANNPATSRPPPPRSRNRATQLRTTSGRSNSSHSIASKAAPDVHAAQSPSSSSDRGIYRDDDRNIATVDAEAARSETKYGALGLGDGLAVTSPVGRTSSSGSARSYNSRYDPVYTAEEIPKEEIELALQGLSRDDLVVALGRAKVQMDEIDAKLDAQILASEELQASSNSLLSQLSLAEAENESLNIVIRQREERIDDLMADQDRMESEVYSKMQVIESLRKQLNDSEKRRNDAERRYGDQTTTMDKERQYYVDTEALLKSQKATQAASYEKLLSQHHELYKEHERLSNKLSQMRAQGAFGSQAADSDGSGADDDDDDDAAQAAAADDGADNGGGAATDAQARRPSVPGRRVSTSASGSRKHAPRTLAEEKEYETLKDELVTIQRSHTSLTDAIATLQTELRDVRGENAILRDQNETFIDILQEKTFSGALLSESAMISAGLGRQRLRGASRLVGPYESDDEDDDADEDDDDLGGDNDEGREANTTRNTSVDNADDDDDVDDVPDTPKAPSGKAASGKTSSRNVRRRKQSTSILAPHPTDLASELEQSGSLRSEAQISPDEKKRRQERRNERHGAISDNVEELQKEVRELREANQALTLYIAKIIDRIIAREGYENILAVDGKGTVRGGTRRKQSKANLRAMPYDTFENPNQTKRSVSNTSAATNASTSSGGGGGGGGLFRFGGGAASNNDAASKFSKPHPPKPKRGSSIDWRSLPFLGGGGGTSSNNAGPEPNPNLKPLTLASASTSCLIGKEPAASTGPARKVRSSEEVEDEADVAERERIRTELLRRGIQPPSHQLVQGPQSPSTAAAAASAMSGGRTRTTSDNGGASSSGGGGFAAFFSRVVTSGGGGGGGGSGNESKAVTSPDRSDTLSDASTTPGSRFNSLDSAATRTRSGTVGANGEAFPRTSTPLLSDPEKRREERTRAIQLSGSGLTEFVGGEGLEGEGIGAVARARARARRDRTALTLATSRNGNGEGKDEGTGSGTPSSTPGGASESSSVGVEGGFESGSFLEDSIAGDESYSLPPPPAAGAGAGMEGASPLLGYGNALPPLTTGEEKEQGAMGPATGWKRALRRISILGGGSGGAPGAGGGAAGGVLGPSSSPAVEQTTFSIDTTQ